MDLKAFQTYLKDGQIIEENEQESFSLNELRELENSRLEGVVFLSVQKVQDQGPREEVKFFYMIRINKLQVLNKCMTSINLQVVSTNTTFNV